MALITLTTPCSKGKGGKSGKGKCAPADTAAVQGGKSKGTPTDIAATQQRLVYSVKVSKSNATCSINDTFCVFTERNTARRNNSAN